MVESVPAGAVAEMAEAGDGRIVREDLKTVGREGPRRDVNVLKSCQ